MHESGSLPSFDELKKFANENPFKLNKSWSLIKEMSRETIAQKKLSKSSKTSLNNMNIKYTQRKTLDKSVFVTQKQNVVGGGTNNILNALAAYLRYLEGTARDDWQEYVMIIYLINLFTTVYKVMLQDICFFIFIGLFIYGLL